MRLVAGDVIISPKYTSFGEVNQRVYKVVEAPDIDTGMTGVELVGWLIEDGHMDTSSAGMLAVLYAEELRGYKKLSSFKQQLKELL